MKCAHTAGTFSSARVAWFIPSLIGASILSLAVCISACSPEAPPATARTRSTIPVKSYTVKGVVEAVPVADKPSTQFIVRHEEIPDFVASDGRLGMNKMAMPFPLGEGVSVEGLKPGDPVVLDFTVDWNASPAYWITKITRFEEPASSSR